MTEVMTDDERAAELARRIKIAQADKDDIEEYIENLKGALAEIKGQGEHVVGDNENGFLKTTVYQHKTFNEAYGKANRPDLWEKAVQDAKPVVTSAVAKAALTEEEYAEFQKPSPKLSVKVEVLD